MSVTAILKSQVDRACFLVREALLKESPKSKKSVSVWVDADGNFVCRRGSEAPWFSVVSVNGVPVSGNHSEEPVRYPLGVISK